MRRVRAAHLPEAVRAVRVPARPRQKTRPEHEALRVLATGLADSLVAHLAVHDGNRGISRIGLADAPDRVRDALPIAVTGLKHVHVEK